MKLDREQILSALLRIATCRPNDAIALALNPQEINSKRLNLWGVSEWKANANGSVEIKFVDRAKLFALLLEATSFNDEGMDALLDALEATAS